MKKWKSEAPAETAFERFTRHGPIALLPLQADEPDRQRFALVMTEPNECAKAVQTMQDDDFLSLLQKEFGGRVGRFVRVGKRNAYPLIRTHSSEQIRSGIVLLGNAAHTLHPVAGQGFNLAMRDLICLARLIVDARQHNQSPGDLELLERYVEQRRFDQQRTDLGTHFLTQLFASDSAVTAASRQLAMLGLSNIPVARRAFIRAAAGLKQQ